MTALTVESLRALFSKPYGVPAPSEEQWRELYAEDVRFEDPTQQHQGIAAYIAAQEGLIRRCDDVYLLPSLVVVDQDRAFVEWEMGLKIKGMEFVYPGVSRLRLNQDGKVCDHRDYFDFVGPTFGPVPLLGPAVRWLYKRFVS